MFTLGEIIKEKEDTNTKRTGEEAAEVKYDQEKKALEAKIRSMQKKLEMAERNVERVQMEVDRLRYDPILPEPSLLDEIERVRRLIPNTPPPERGEAHPRNSLGAVQWRANRKHRTRIIRQSQRRYHREIGTTRSRG